MKKLFNEFKKFISRGNVIDLAVGVIIGSAFTAIVTSVTKGVLTPLINGLLQLILGKSSLSEIYTYLIKVMDASGNVDLVNSVYIDWGSVINAIINFFLTAIILFFIIKAINNTKELLPKFGGFTKKEYIALRKQGLTYNQIVELGKKKAEEEEAIKKAEEEEKKKHTTEGLLEQIKDILLENKNSK